MLQLWFPSMHSNISLAPNVLMLASTNMKGAHTWKIVTHIRYTTLATHLTRHSPHYNEHRSHTLLTALSRESGSLTLKHRRNTFASWYARGRTLSYAPVPGTPMQQNITLSVDATILWPGTAAGMSQRCCHMHRANYHTHFWLLLSKCGSIL